jgi:hypothetical protein
MGNDTGGYATCACRHCAGGIEFPVEGVGQEIECPHCGSATQLYSPIHGAASRVRSNPRRLLTVTGVVLLVAALCIAYVFTPKKVNGQIFVFLTNGQTLKLSGVRIKVVKASEGFAAEINGKWSQAKTNLSLLREKRATLDQVISLKRTQRDLAASIVVGTKRLLQLSDYTIDLFTDSVTNRLVGGFMQDDARRSLVIEKAKRRDYEAEDQRANSDLRGVESELRERSAELAGIVDRISHWESSSIYDDLHWPQEVTRTKSDADGRFSISIPKRGRFIVAASTSFVSLGATKELLWFAELKQQPGDFFLNNDNLLTAP